MRDSAIEAEKAIITERRRQYDEAVRLLDLAWEAGAFDDLDLIGAGPEPGTLCRRVESRAVEVLAGQYPEVQVHAKWEQNGGWSMRTGLGLSRAPRVGERPRCKLMIHIRPRLKHSRTGLRPVRR